jgi:Lamin Tail Domain
VTSSIPATEVSGSGGGASAAGSRGSSPGAQQGRSVTAGEYSHLAPAEGGSRVVPLSVGWVDTATYFIRYLIVSHSEKERRSRFGQVYDGAAQGLDLLTKVGGMLAVYLTLAATLSWWPFAGPPDVRIDVSASLVNPKGYDNGSDEYVCLVNEDGDGVSLLGWELRDAEGGVNVLPDVTLDSGQALRVHPGGGKDSATDVYGEGNAAVWNNDGDTITLLDESGDRIDSQSYGSHSSETTAAGCGSG